MTSEPSVEKLLWTEGYLFDFFQAVRLLHRLYPDRPSVGEGASPAQEVVRFRAHQSLAFPPSAIVQMRSADALHPTPGMVVSFLGLTGSSGVLPRHYTQIVIRKAIEGKSPQEKYGLRDWFDLFNHRLISLFYRAWEKYRFYLEDERQPGRGREAGAFTLALFSLMGLGLPPLQQRLKLVAHDAAGAAGAQVSDHASLASIVPTSSPAHERLLGRIEDLGLLRYSGLFAHRPRSASALESMLRGFLGVDVHIGQFQGQWLQLEESNQSAASKDEGNNCLGRNVIVGDRIWEVQSKVRVRLGPLTFAQFSEFVPDRAPSPRRKAIFLLAQLVRLYVGPERDVEIQPTLKAAEVPRCQVGATAQLGWNTWSRRLPAQHDAADAVFQADDRNTLTATW